MTKPFVVLSVERVPDSYVVTDDDLSSRREKASVALKRASSDAATGDFSAVPFLKAATMTSTQGHGGLFTDEGGNFLKAFGTPHRHDEDSHGWTFETTDGKVFSVDSRMGAYRVFVKDCDIPDLGVMALLFYVVNGGAVVLLGGNETC